jgi:hypothetical protein
MFKPAFQTGGNNGFTANAGTNNFSLLNSGNNAQMGTGNPPFKPIQVKFSLLLYRIPYSRHSRFKTADLNQALIKLFLCKLSLQWPSIAIKVSKS